MSFAHLVSDNAGDDRFFYLSIYASTPGVKPDNIKERVFCDSVADRLPDPHDNSVSR